MAGSDEFELPLPLGGISDDLAHSKQKTYTTREQFNMRSQDPTNGRERWAQRSGMSKACEGEIQAGIKVIEINSAVFDARNVTYGFTPGQESYFTADGGWAYPTTDDQQLESTPMGVTDSEANLYFVDAPSSVTKLNPDGQKVWQFSLPVKSDTHSARFLFVDDLFDVYVGVSFGTRQELSRLWKLRQLPDDGVEVAWELPLTAYVEMAKVQSDKLYTIQNEPDTKTSYVRIYDSLDAARPRLVQEWSVAHPAHDLDTNQKGDVFVASGISFDVAPDVGLALQRASNPKFPRFGPPIEDWVISDDEALTLWSMYDPDKVTEFDVAGIYQDGAPIVRIPDVSGHERHFYVAVGKKPCLLAFDAVGKHKAFRFNGVDTGMTTLSNSSTALAFADQQRTALPGYVDSMFCSIWVIRPDKTATAPQAVFGQQNTAAGATPHILTVNRNAATALGALVPGAVAHYAATDASGDGGQGTNGHPLQGSFDNRNDIAIVVMLWDGGIEPNDTTAVTRSLFQVNGVPIDRYEGLGNLAKDPTLLGYWTSVVTAHYQGDILFGVTLDRRNRTALTEPKILTHDELESISANVDQTDNQLTRIVGWLAHRFGVQALLPNDTASFTHPYGPQTRTIDTVVVANGLAGPPTGADTGYAAKVQQQYGLLAKYNPQGSLVWTINGTDADPLSPGDRVVGVGFGVRVAPDGNVFSMGPSSQTVPIPFTNESSNFLRRVIDQGDAFSLAAIDGAWGVDVGDPPYKWPRMAVDEFGNVYAPIATGTNGLRVYKGSDGTLISAVAIGIPERLIYWVALDPKIPDYGTDLTNEIARFVYVGGQAGSDPSVQAFKVRMVQESPVSGSPREVKHLAIAANGAIRTFVLGGSVSIPAGAAGKLSTTANYIQSVAAFEKIYITDGVSPIAVYDPRTDTVSVLTSTSSGSPPHGAKILELWSGRLVAARAAQLLNGAFNWQMSAKGDPNDWDNFRPDRSSAGAISGDNREGPGHVPDIVNAFIPYNDDLGFWGCDHTIWMMSGDPRDGGQFDLVSDITGIAFGRPWCKDPQGNVWFVGSRGGLFLMRPGGLPERVSLRNFDRRLSSIDFGAHYVRLAWNDDDQGVHIMRFPFGAVGDPLEHWFFDAKRMAPCPDTFGTVSLPSVNPTAIFVVDGDEPDDRRVLLGCQDGFIRQWDADEWDDDGTAIDANGIVGPLLTGEGEREYRFVGPRVVLASEHAGCLFQLFATDDPANPGTARHTGGLVPGRNPMKRDRMRGAYCFIRFQNASVGQRFAIEEAGMRAYQGGMKRARETR